jgi:hypothetical protein
VVSSDVREVVRALDRECDLDEGYISVGVDLDIALCIVRGLKSLVEEIERRQVVRVVLVLEEDVDFPRPSVYRQCSMLQLFHSHL